MPSNETPEPQPDEFVVDTTELGLIRDMIPHQILAEERDDRLGLTLVTLTSAAQAANEVEATAERLKISTTHTPAPKLDVDRLLANLRTVFKNRYGNWCPTMGKNRVLRGVELLPYPSAGGSDLRAADESDKSAYGRAPARKGTRVRVGILDTPVYPHKELTGRFLANKGSILWPNGEPQESSAGHGTFVAGLITQRAPAATLVIRSVLDSQNGTAPVWDVARRLVRRTDYGLDILNLSFGCDTVDEEAPLVLARAIEQLTSKMVVVAAAGNHGDPASKKISGMEGLEPWTPLWPAAFPDVVAVGAFDIERNRPALFTPRRKNATVADHGMTSVAPWIDMLAPGVAVPSLYLCGPVKLPGANAPTELQGWAVGGGTSFAAAAVTGALAALTIPGRRSAQEALHLLRTDKRTQESCGITLVPS